MYYEPYGLLDPQALDIYIRSQSSCEVVARTVKTCFLQIEAFMKSLETCTVVDDNTLNIVKEELGLSNKIKTKMICNGLIKGDSPSKHGLSDEQYKRIEEILTQRVSKSYKLPDGTTLSNFQCRLVEYIDREVMNRKRGRLRGIDVYMRVINSAAMRGGREPNLFGRNVSNIANYQSTFPIIQNLNVATRTNMSIAWNEINSFKYDYLKDNEIDDYNDIKNLISSSDKLRHLLTSTTDVNVLCKYYLEDYFKQFTYEYFNNKLGTNLTEIEMHKEFMDILSKGLCGFNLCTEYFLDEMDVHFKKSKLSAKDLANNENIKFITGPLYNMITNELAIMNL